MKNIRTLFQRKQSSKKTPQPDTSWTISTKVYEKPENILTKSRKVKNPHIETVKSAGNWIKNYLRTVGWLFFVGLFAVGIVVLFATPIFTLKPDRIELVLKPEPVFDRPAIASLLRDFAGKNVFSLSTQEIFLSLSENIRHIASVEKTVLFPDGVRITVSSFRPSYRAFIGEERFLLTENGQLIPDIAEVEAPALQIFHLVQDSNIGKTTPIADADMYAIRTILNAWKESLSFLSITELRFYEQEKELHIVTDKTRIIFSLENGGKEVATLAHLITSNAFSLDKQKYIDMRVSRRVYICALDDSNCAVNLRNIYDSN